MIPDSEARLNILVAYPYATATILAELTRYAADVRWVLDCGAFTAWKSGKTIALDDYCRFIERLPVRPWRYFALDVVGDPEASMRNYETMRARGFDPMPVFTRGEALAALDTYYETSEVVGVGGLVGTPGNKGFVNGLMRHVAGRRVHLLGFANDEYVRTYRPYMCDSSTWISPLRFGLIKLYQDGRPISVKKADFAKRPSAEVLALIREFGIDPRELGRAAQWVNNGRGESALELLTFRTTVRHQLETRRMLGTHLFMAVTTFEQITPAHDAFRFWRDRRPDLFA